MGRPSTSLDIAAYGGGCDAREEVTRHGEKCQPNPPGTSAPMVQIRRLPTFEVVTVEAGCECPTDS